MFEVTELATEKIREFFKTRDAVSPMRVFIAGMGCSGPQLGISLDEKNDSDEVFEENGFTFLVEKALLDEAKPIKLDYIVTPQGEGFYISSALMRADDCGGGDCGGGCSCC
jgi:iron-sulfur cluster assembly accessory protein